jgi:hypothetical protein
LNIYLRRTEKRVPRRSAIDQLHPEIGFPDHDVRRRAVNGFAIAANGYIVGGPIVFCAVKCNDVTCGWRRWQGNGKGSSCCVQVQNIACNGRVSRSFDGGTAGGAGAGYRDHINKIFRRS